MLSFLISLAALAFGASARADFDSDGVFAARTAGRLTAMALEALDPSVRACDSSRPAELTTDEELKRRLGLTLEESRGFDQHFGRDSMSQYCTSFPDPSRFRNGCGWEGWVSIRAHQAYGGVLDVPYSYRIGCFEGKLTVRVSVSLSFPEWSLDQPSIAVNSAYCDTHAYPLAYRSRKTGQCRMHPLEMQVNSYTQWLLSEAERRWSGNSAFGVTYQFAEDPGRRADVNVPVIDGFTRGPYFAQWGSVWGPDAVAHELGHVMGLNDEYSEVSGQAHCGSSIMCHPLDPVRSYHEYLILRRAYCGTEASANHLRRYPVIIM